MKIIMKALVGSHLYGLANEDSDEDYNGIFLYPTKSLFQLSKPAQTLVTKNPDTTMHEVEKFIYLAAKGNPTILELLFVPKYEILEPEGELLLSHRDWFLSNRVRFSFGGYAYQQSVKLQKRENEGLEGFGPKTKKRYSKHARHCFRLLKQGKELLETGTLSPVLDNPDEIFAIGELPVEELIAKFKVEYEEFNKAKSILPDEPNWEELDELLLSIRMENL
jgi:predicted nucleotidyltransferase